MMDDKICMYLEDFYDEYVPIDEIPDLDEIKERLEKILNIIYETGKVQDLESELEEVIYPFGLKLPETTMKIQGE